MKIVIGILAILLIGIIGVTMTRPQTTESESKENTVFKIEQEAVLLDVRTTQEYASSHFENAINHDVQLMESGQMPELSKETKLYVYCRSGNRSATAKSLLVKAGYSDVTDLGGLSDVSKLGLQYANN